MGKLENDSREIKLTSEFVEKSDRDIATIQSLDELAKKTGNILVLSGGYAVEALCGGEITRPHGDVDAHFILTGNDRIDLLCESLEKILFAEETKWKLRNKRPDKVEYVEDVENKGFDEKRRVEVYFNEPHEYNVKYPLMNLSDSAGKNVEVHIVELMEIVSQKIQKFYSLRGGIDTTKERHSSVTDYYDLNRLLELDELDVDKLKQRFPKEYEYAVSLLSNFAKREIL